MGFWKKSADEEERERQKAAARHAELVRQEHDLDLLKRGDIPMQATQRLRELGATDSADAMFTSDLAPDEMALLRRKGYRARGLVTGSSMFHVGRLYVSHASDCEIDKLSQAYNEATALAVQRLQKELNLIGAHGVLGVRMNIARHEWAEKTIEVQIIGTAVEANGPPPKKPWLSDLSAQEWFALERAGYEPVGLVWGHCAWWLYTTAMDEITEQSWSNVEMTHWSDGLSAARQIAVSRILAQAGSLGANGVVGVNIERRLDHMRLAGGYDEAARERLHHNLLFTIVGTAVRATGRAAVNVQATVPVLSLLDGRLQPVVMRQGRDFKVDDGD
jgi:uncharacterized protein YbjQ (UPF0145 family)